MIKKVVSVKIYFNLQSNNQIKTKLTNGLFKKPIIEGI